MRVKLNAGCIALTVLLFCSADLAHAEKNYKKENRGKKVENKGAKKFKAPAGWKKGLKKGWKTTIPPGWDKWDKKKKAGWEKALKYQKRQIRNRAKKNDWDAKDRDAVVNAFEFAVRSGVVAADARLIMDGCIVHGIKGSGIKGVGIALADGVGKEDNYRTLATQIVAKLNEDYKGEALVGEIYNLIDIRHDERKKKALKKKSGKKTKKSEKKAAGKEKKTRKSKKK